MGFFSIEDKKVSNGNWETDIALIKADIKQIQKFFGKTETAIDTMLELSKNVAVQQEVLYNTRKQLEDTEKLIEETKKTEELRMNVLSDRLEEYRRMAREDHQRLAEHNAEKRSSSNKEILEKLDAMERSLHNRINEQSKRINALENWRYYMMGVGAILTFIFVKINWPSLFN